MHRLCLVSVLLKPETLHPADGGAGDWRAFRAKLVAQGSGWAARQAQQNLDLLEEQASNAVTLHAACQPCMLQQPARLAVCTHENQAAC
jgi:hypothetical protein